MVMKNIAIIVIKLSRIADVTWLIRKTVLAMRVSNAINVVLFTVIKEGK